MHNTTRSLIFIALAYISTVFLSGCSEPTLVGNDLLVNGQEFVTDTAILDLVIYPEREDSIISSSVANLSATSLGIINSPYFGRIKSGFFTEILLSANGVDFGDATLDSMVLVLDYLAVLGDSTSSHDLRVYEVTEEITRDTLYNNYEFAYDSLPIGTLNGYQFNNVDDIVLGGEDTVGAQLRIPLDPIFAQKFLDENADTSSTVFNTDDDLHEWFRGLYITVDDANSSENSMAFFNTISGTVSRMVLYYTTQDTIQTAFSFQISFAANQHVRIDTDYSGSGVETLLAQNPPLNQRSVLAPMAGINSIISIPDIMDYSDKLISKAEIILPVLPFEDHIDTVYQRPTNTSTFWREDGEITDLISDIQISSTLYNYNGTLVESDTLDYYILNVAASLQEMTDGTRDNPEYIIYQSPRRAAIRRVLLGGGDHPDPKYRARLNLYYTDIE